MAAAGGAAQRPEKARRGGWLGLLFGLVFGALGAIFLPRFARPYLPAGLRGDDVQILGVVQAKSAEPDRLLLTVGSDAGAMLVTFQKKVAEIDQLVSVGESVQLTVQAYAPFVDDARISRVMKHGDWRPAPAGQAVDSMRPAVDSAGTLRGPDSGAAGAPDSAAAEGTQEGQMDTNGMMNASGADSTGAGAESLPDTTP